MHVWRVLPLFPELGERSEFEQGRERGAGLFWFVSTAASHRLMSQGCKKAARIHLWEVQCARGEPGAALFVLHR